jgi:hypothetical protein
MGRTCDADGRKRPCNRNPFALKEKEMEIKGKADQS